MKVGCALIGGSDEVLALGRQSWVKLEGAICFSRLAGSDKTGRYGAGGRGGAKAAVNHRVDGSDERRRNHEKQSGAGQRDAGPNAARGEALESASGRSHGKGIRYPPPMTVSISGGSP